MLFVEIFYPVWKALKIFVLFYPKQSLAFNLNNRFKLSHEILMTYQALILKKKYHLSGICSF